MLMPQAWRKTIIEKYGSISNFHDAPTIKILRHTIEAMRARNKELIDTEERHPGTLGASRLEEIKRTDAEIVAIDDELAAWQAARRKKKAS